MKKLLYFCFLTVLSIIPQRFSLAEGHTDNDCISADIILLVDRSGSQKLYKNEMLYAIQNILFELPISETQVRIGMISFADSAKLQSNITGDRDYLMLLIDSLYDISIESSSTYIEQSIFMTPSLFKESEKTRGHIVYKAIIILSDGEISRWEDALPILRNLELKYSIYVYSLGIGSDEHSNCTLNCMATDSSYFGGDDVEQIIAKLNELSVCP